MLHRLRPLARRLVGVSRVSTYYLPWLTRPGLACVLLINNIESRFTSGRDARRLPATVTQHDADGRVVRRYEVTLEDSADAREVELAPTAAGVGFVIVDAPAIRSDLYVALADGESYTATHGRHEFVERYPVPIRAVMAVLGAALALVGRTLPAFARDQYVYLRADSRSHVLLLNLSNVVNRIRVVAHHDGVAIAARLLRVAPMGAALLDVASLLPAGGRVARLRLSGNAWFNLYLVGAGPRDLAGPVSLMHVK